MITIPPQPSVGLIGLHAHHRRQECRRSDGWATLLSPLLPGSLPTKTSFGPDGKKPLSRPTIGDRSVAGPSDGRHSCRPWCMGAHPPKQVLAPTGRNRFPGPPTATGVSPVRRMGDTLVAPAAWERDADGVSRSGRRAGHREAAGGGLAADLPGGKLPRLGGGRVERQREGRRGEGRNGSGAE